MGQRNSFLLHPRKDFLRLINEPETTLATLVKRHQMPMVPPADSDPDFVLSEVPLPGSKEADPGWDARGWSTTIAYAYIVQRSFVEDHRLQIERAVQIARHVLGAEPLWSRIRALADMQIEDRAPFEPDIVIASIIRRDASCGIGFGTVAEIGSLANDIVSLTAVSLVRAAVVLQRRASEHRIDISSWWQRS